MWNTRGMRSIAAQAGTSEFSRWFVQGGAMALAAGAMAHLVYNQPITWYLVVVSVITGYLGAGIGVYAWRVITDSRTPVPGLPGFRWLRRRPK